MQMQLIRFRCNSTAAEFPDRRCSAGSGRSEENESDAAGSLSTTADTVNITEALAELAQNNAEAADFVADYPNRQNYLGQSIDLASDVLIGQVPLLLQWDKRWGYESYGDNIIGLAGCGPT